MPNIASQSFRHCQVTYPAFNLRACYEISHCTYYIVFNLVYQDLIFLYTAKD